MITEDYVSFETAKLLKEKGFDGILPCVYIDTKKSDKKPCLLDTLCNYNDGHIKDVISAPTLQMAMKWLREKHNLFIFISTWLRHKDGTVQYYYEIRNLNDKDFETIADSTITEFDSPEKTCEAAIKYSLQNLI